MQDKSKWFRNSLGIFELVLIRVVNDLKEFYNS